MLESPCSSVASNISSSIRRSSPLSSSQFTLVSLCIAKILARLTLAFSPSENLSKEPQSTPSRIREMEILSLIFPLFKTVKPENAIRMSLPMASRNSLVIWLRASILVLARWVLNSVKVASCSLYEFNFRSIVSFSEMANTNSFSYFFLLALRDSIMSVSEEFSMSRIDSSYD